MSLIRKHRAVLQAWACLALVTVSSTSATSIQLPSQCRNIERERESDELKNTRHRCQPSSHCHRTCEQPGIILLVCCMLCESCEATTYQLQDISHGTRRVPCNRRCQVAGEFLRKFLNCTSEGVWGTDVPPAGSRGGAPVGGLGTKSPRS